jgi:hypothetical protein
MITRFEEFVVEEDVTVTMVWRSHAARRRHHPGTGRVNRR